jgi:hypothetical protein
MQSRSALAIATNANLDELRDSANLDELRDKMKPTHQGRPYVSTPLGCGGLPTVVRA